MAKKTYVIPPAKTPLRLIVVLSLGAVLLLGGIFFAIWYSGNQIADAKMAGIITKKEFTPQPEQQVILGKDSLTAREKAGEYFLTVEVRSRQGETNSYNVWVGKELYDSLKVGDPFLVGPYLERN